MKIPVIIVLTFICSISYSQNTFKASYKSLKNITFPEKFDSAHIKGAKIYYCNFNNLSFQSSISDTLPLNYSSLEEYNKIMNNVVNGYFSSSTFKGLNTFSNDTIINGKSGKFVHGINSSNTPSKIREFFGFITVLNGAIYNTTVMLLNGSKKLPNSVIEQFLNSLEFSKEEQF